MRLLHSSMSKAILGDASGIVRLEIWGPAAKQHVEKLTAADAAEGHALVTLVNAEVVGRNGSTQLQCLPTSNVEITLPSEEHVPLNLAGIEKAKMVVEHYLPLTSHVPPMTVTVLGVICELEDMRSTTQLTNQRVVGIVDKNGYGLKVLTHGYWAEETFDIGEEWIFAYIDI